MSLQIIELGLIPVQSIPIISRDDRDWLRKQFGDFPSVIDLALNRFPDHYKWPEFDPTKKYGIAWFNGESLAPFNAVDERLAQEGFGPEKRTFPFHLAIEVVPRCDELWSRCQQGKGPGWIYASSIEGFWRCGGGGLCVPCVYVHPNDRESDARLVERSFDDSNGFLVLLD